jgi:hypothetical protein
VPDDDTRGSVTGMAASPRFRPYDDALKARLRQLAKAFYGCQLAFLAAIDTSGGPYAPGSPADADAQVFAEPRFPPLARALVRGQSYFYVSAAAEHMRGLGALYDKEEVLIPPPVLVRCVLEYSARVVWLLADDQQSEGRLARAYLEQLFSAVERKKTSGRLLGKHSSEHRNDTAELKALRDKASHAFGENVVDDQGQHRIRGERRPGLEDCVAALVRRLPADAPAHDHRGVYDYVSNFSHPTVYPHIEMWRPIEVDGARSFELAITAEDHDRRATLAIASFCEALNHLIGYHGWSREPYDRLRETLALLLPT